MALSDGSEKVAQKSTDDASLTDWNLGFHIFLVNIAKSPELFVIWLIILVFYWDPFKIWPPL